jgi:DNA-binding transcriptional LysR family regulator
MKHAETLVGVKLFSRRGGRYIPAPQANAIFSQINSVYDKVEDLRFVISRIKQGANTELKDRFGAEHCERHGAACHRGAAARLAKKITSC